MIPTPTITIANKDFERLVERTATALCLSTTHPDTPAAVPCPLCLSDARKSLFAEWQAEQEARL